MLGGDDNPARLANIYMNEICNICEESLEDGTTILRDDDRDSRIICEECAYCIHCDYESQL